MTDSELEKLLADIESDLVERKASIAEKDNICQAVCAFANDLPNHQRPGVVFIGAKDDGSCAGLSVTDELLREISDIRSNGNIYPFPSMMVQKKSLSGCAMAVVEVQPSDVPPVRYRGRVWIRVGPRRAQATPEEERRLAERRRTRDLPYDLWPLKAATISELDLDVFRREYLPSAVATEVLEDNRRSIEEQLASVRFVTVGGDPKPTVLGMLVSGKDPREFMPGAYVQFLRLDGRDLTDPIRDQKEIGGPLPELLRSLETTFEAHVSTAADIVSGPREERRPDYPAGALRQLARNAVLHRTYEGTNAPVRIMWFSDRIEMLSPGGPFGQVTRDNFGRPGVTDYRNPHLAESMKNLGYVQRFGMGIPLAEKEMRQNANPPLEFDIQETQVLVTLRRRP